jgi:hypothetical protein
VIVMPGKQSGTQRPKDEAPELTAAQVVKAALGQLRKLTAAEPVGATGARPTDQGWQVEIEVVEERHVPSTSDLMALYEVDLDLDGELLSYRRASRYVRGRASSDGGSR